MADFWRAVVPAVDSLAENRAIGFLTVIGRLAARDSLEAAAEADALSRVAEPRQGRPARRPALGVTRRAPHRAARPAASGPCSSSSSARPSWCS